MLLGIFAADCVLEVGGVTAQAWRGQPSHLNTSTPLNAVIVYSLAFGGAVLVVVLGVLAVVAARGRVTGPPSRVLAYRAGFALLLAGLGSGVAMIAVGTSTMRTGAVQYAYAITGFLKPFHAFSLHGVLVLPALAHLLERRTGDEHLRWRVVAAAIGAYALLCAALLGLEVAAL